MAGVWNGKKTGCLVRQCQKAIRCLGRDTKNNLAVKGLRQERNWLRERKSRAKGRGVREGKVMVVEGGSKEKDLRLVGRVPKIRG